MLGGMGEEEIINKKMKIEMYIEETEREGRKEMLGGKEEETRNLQIDGDV